MPKDLVTLADWQPDEVRDILELASRLKEDAADDSLEPVLEHQTLALLFEKSSMRTRVSFEVAANQLGGSSVYLSKDDVNLGGREPVKDGARAMARYVDVVAARTRSHDSVVELAKWSDIPVINALSDLYHPCQALGDMLTIGEKFGGLQDRRVAYVGDCNNVARSLALACAMLGLHYRVGCPSDYQFGDQFRRTVQRYADENGTSFEVMEAPEHAVAHAEVVYTDTWISMGQEQEARTRRESFQEYRVDEILLEKAAPSAKVMHCLPAHRGEEITDDVIEGPRSIVFDQAENRLHAERALLHNLVATE